MCIFYFHFSESGSLLFVSTIVLYPVLLSRLADGGVELWSGAGKGLRFVVGWEMSVDLGGD